MLEGRNTFVDLCAIGFGIGAWIAVNGVWVELPLLVQELPEYWNLASYMTLDTQIANLGPILYSFIRYAFPSLKQSPVIYCVLLIGCTSSLLLALFWDQTSIIGGELHSTGFLILVFFLAFVDCTSSVLYVPYMSQWKEKYFTSYLIGEGLSGLLPSLLALGQGVGGNADCVNVTTVNETDGSVTWHIEEAKPDPRFSVDVFFYFIFLMMLVSSTSFLFLENASPLQSERSDGEDRKLIEEERSVQPKKQKTINRGSFIFLMCVQGYACFLANGFLTSIQSYSCGPYGNIAYHLATVLSSMCSPLVAFSTIFISRGTPRRIGLLMTCGTVVASYIISTAAMSPEPPMMGTTGGSVVIVLVWVSWAIFNGYVRNEINNMMREISSDKLYWSGVSTQIGSFTGAIVAFFLVNKTDLFTSYSPCY